LLCALTDIFEEDVMELDSAGFARRRLRRVAKADGCWGSEESPAEEFREGDVRGANGEKFGQA